MTSIAQALKILQSLSIEVTALRQEVLTILAKSKKPITAYQILSKLQLVRPSAKPMTVYRTLSTFEKAHLIHKIEKDSSYVLCCHPNKENHCLIVFCSVCGKYKEIHNSSVQNVLQQTLEPLAFTFHEEPIQIAAICADCFSAN
jgi:Fur family zinc uptake transcriptional regulator